MWPGQPRWLALVLLVKRPVLALVERPVLALVERPVLALVKRPVLALVERPVRARYLRLEARERAVWVRCSGARTVLETLERAGWRLVWREPAVTFRRAEPLA